VPKSLLGQWEVEIKKHLSGLLASGGVHVFYGPRRERDAARLRRFEFVLTTYDTVRNSLGQARVAFRMPLLTACTCLDVSMSRSR
jgi:SNF2 family DNA or RNA helicase